MRARPLGVVVLPAPVVGIERISAECGLSPETLRHHFSRLLHTSPSAYRRTFTARV